MTGQITGRHVLIGFVVGFGVIIAVNLVLAVRAVQTFPGLETRNSYVSSQTFDADRKAQEALGWTVDLSEADGILRLAITDATGQAVAPELTRVTLGRATSTAQDRSPEFTFDGAAFVAPVDIGPGYWNLRLEARAEDGTAFRQRLKLSVVR